MVPEGEVAVAPGTAQRASARAKKFPAFFKRVVGAALTLFRRLLVPFEQTSALRLLDWLQWGAVLLYKARPLDVPILHILCEDEPRTIWAHARFGWRRNARRGVEEHVLPLDHFNILHESNLPRIVDILLKSCGTQSERSHVQLTAARE